MDDNTQSNKVPTQPVEKKTSGKAIASLVLGIVSIFIGLLPVIGWATIVLALIFGFKAHKEIKNNPQIEGKGMATAGIIMGFIMVIPAILWFFVGFMAFFGVLNPNVLVPEKCIMATGLSCNDYALYVDGAASINIENGFGKNIQVTDFRLIDSQTGETICTTSSSTVEIMNNSSSTFEFLGCSFKDAGRKEKVNLELDYYFSDSNPQFSHVVTGEILADIE